MKDCVINMENKELMLIPKVEIYMQYMLDVMIKLPRTEKFSIGNEYKKSMYDLLKQAVYIPKIDFSKRLYYIQKIDAELVLERIYLRLMLKNRWIDEKKFKVAINLISEIGKIVGGLIKYYAKNNKK